MPGGDALVLRRRRLALSESVAAPLRSLVVALWVVAGALALAPEDREAVGQRARAHVIAEFSTVSLQASTLRVYHEVLNSHP